MVSTRPSLQDIRVAADRIRPAARRTPLVPFQKHIDPERIYLKVETLQPVNSFKIRGVFNAVAKMDEKTRRRGVSTVSAGNTAQALAWSANYFGVSARSLIPASAPQSKISAMQAYGGEPILVPIAEVFHYLREHAWENEPYSFIHPWTNHDLMTGHGSLGLEIYEDLPYLDSVFVPVGGGGLIGGVGSAIKALKPNVKLIAVEPEGCAALHSSLQAGKPQEVDCNTICDGVSVPYITEEMFPLLSKLVDDTRLVSEKKVKSAVKSLALHNKIIAEPAGGLALAAALDMPEAERGYSVCLVTGGSIDSVTLVDILRDKTL